MWGAVVGGIAGSRFEGSQGGPKDFELLHRLFMYTCGMIAFGPDGNLVGEGDYYAQTMQVYRNIAAVLALEGATMADVVKTTAWLPDMSLYRDYARGVTEALDVLRSAPEGE